MNIVSVVVESIATYQVKLYYQNYLESAIVTVTSEDAAFPKYRLYDRAQGLLFKGTTHPNPFGILADLGASGPYPAIDTCILGKNHNLTGLAIDLYYSSNGVDYYLAKSWVAAAGIDRQSFIQRTVRYWAFYIIASPANPEIGELFLTKCFSFDRNPDLGYQYGDDKNFNRVLTQSGMAQKTKLGERKKARSYRLTNISPLQKTDLENFDLGIDGMKNFYIEDIEGNLFFAEMPQGLPRFEAKIGDRWDATLDVLEVLD